MTQAPLAPGQTLDHFRILAQVGQGGMGIVYRAVDIGLGRTVALKLLDSSRVDSGDARARFHREAAAAAQLKHPHIATVYEFGEYKDQSFIVLEWVEGETLQALLTRAKKLPLDHALAIFIQIADALTYAHARGVLHRDVKPANIMLSSTDDAMYAIAASARATLVDFGLVGLAHDTDATLGGNFFGTPRYMAPEQIRGEACDGRADEYALALVLYEMLAGKPAFDAQTTAALFHQQLFVAPPPLSEQRPDVPPYIERAVSRALEKNPDARFPSVATFHDAVTPAQADAPRAAPPPPRTPAHTIRGRWLVIGGFVGLCLALFAAGALSNNPPPATPTSIVTPSDAPAEPTAKPSSAPTPNPGGAWTLPGGSAAYSNASNDFFPLNPTPRWQTDAQGAPTSGIVAGAGVVIVSVEGGVVRAFDWSNGALVWETNLGAPASGAPALWLTPERGYVFVPTTDSELHALDAGNGKLVWRKKEAELRGKVASNVTVSDDGTLYVAIENGFLHAIEPTGGTVYWTLDTYQEQGFTQPPTLANSAILLASSDKIFALASTLEQVWQAETKGKPSAPLTAIANQGLVIVGTDQGNVAAYNILLGREIWNAETDGAVNGFATDSWFLYATTRAGKAYAWVASSGELAWSAELGGATSAAPLVGAGVLILVSDDGRVRYFSPYTDFSELTELNFQIPDSISAAPAQASGWLFARGSRVWGYGP